jgi:general nucleoside transport system permease protein
MNDFFAALIPTLAATLRTATPLMLCAMGGLFSERSGIIDVGLEGKMLAGAFAAATVAALTGSPWLALASAIAAASLLALLHGYACITHRGNQVVSGVAINILASGLTMVFGNAWFGQGGQTPALAPAARFMPVIWPGVESLGRIALLGPLYARLISGQSLLVYVALLGVAASWFVVGRTRFGLRLRAVGEAPAAIDAAGISVAWLRYRALLLCGIFTGIAGTYIGIAQNANFSKDMSAGQGYIALAALIFGKWRPIPAFGACLIFGLLDAVAIRLQGVRLPAIGEVPVQLIQALPYVLTVILLAGLIGRAVAPKAIGVPYEKEH